MAYNNNKLVVFALLFFAIVGMASAEAATGASAEAANATAAEAPVDNSVVGTLDGGATTTAAPVGGPIPSSVYESLSPAGTPSSGATTVRAFVGAATVVVAATVVTSFF